MAHTIGVQSCRFEHFAFAVAFVVDVVVVVSLEPAHHSSSDWFGLGLDNELMIIGGASELDGGIQRASKRERILKRYTAIFWIV